MSVHTAAAGKRRLYRRIRFVPLASLCVAEKQGDHKRVVVVLELRRLSVCEHATFLSCRRWLATWGIGLNA
jgi:hypothetical protein